MFVGVELLVGIVGQVGVELRRGNRCPAALYDDRTFVLKSVNASASFVPSGIVNLGISSTWQPVQLYRLRTFAPLASAVLTVVVVASWAGTWLPIFSPVRPRTKVITSSTAVGSLAQANWGIRRRSSQVLYFSLVLEVVVAARPVQLLVEEADPGLLLELLLVVRVGAVAVAVALLGLVLEVFGDVAEVEPGRALEAPVVERRADRLGVLEAGDVWQPKQPSRLIVFSPRNNSLSSVLSLLDERRRPRSAGPRPILPSLRLEAPLGDVELDQLVERLLRPPVRRPAATSTLTGHSPGTEMSHEAMSAASWSESWRLGIRLLGWYFSGAWIQLVSHL